MPVELDSKLQSQQDDAFWMKFCGLRPYSSGNSFQHIFDEMEVILHNLKNLIQDCLIPTDEEDIKEQDNNFDMVQIGQQIQSLLGLKPIMRLKLLDQIEQEQHKLLYMKSNQHDLKNEESENIKLNNLHDQFDHDLDATLEDDIDDEEDQEAFFDLDDATKLVKVELGTNPLFAANSIWDDSSDPKNTRKRRNTRKTATNSKKLTKKEPDEIEIVPKKRPGRKRTKNLDLVADPGSLACEECGRICPNRGAYLQHKETHNKTKDFICSHCGKGFKNDRYLQSHISYTHMGKTWVCDFCGKVFKQPSSWRLHKAQKHSTVPPRRPHCEHCGKTFMSNTTLKFHQAVVHQIGEYFQCNQCDRKYAAQLLLDEHVRTRHMGVKYPCAACGKIFHHRQTLKRHQVKNKCTPPESNMEHLGSSGNLEVAAQSHSNNNVSLNLQAPIEDQSELKSQFDNQESHKT